MNNRKQQVLLIAKRLFVEKGFSATSVQDILDEAKISKGTFYNYFSTKNECLLAILEQGRNATMIRRQELIIGQDLSNKSILASQISTRLEVNREHNLIPIFEAVFFSIDPDLKLFVKNYHLEELSWLTNRIIDIYGEDAVPYAPDCAVLMLGMMQHMIHVSTVRANEEIHPIKLVTYVLRRIDSMMIDMIKNKDNLLTSAVFSNLDKELDRNTNLEGLLSRLTKFQVELSPEQIDLKQYTQFLIDEFNSLSPRTGLIESVVRSFRESLMNSSHDQEAQDLAACVWIYLETLKNK